MRGVGIRDRRVGRVQRPQWGSRGFGRLCLRLGGLLGGRLGILVRLLSRLLQMILRARPRMQHRKAQDCPPSGGSGQDRETPMHQMLRALHQGNSKLHRPRDDEYLTTSMYYDISTISASLVLRSLRPCARYPFLPALWSSGWECGLVALVLDIRIHHTVLI